MNVETIYETAFDAINTPAIQAHARKLIDLGLCPVVIPPAEESIKDQDGNETKIFAVGKKPQYFGWPAAALHRTIEPDEIPDYCNLGVLCGTPVERNTGTYYVADIDIDIISRYPHFQ